MKKLLLLLALLALVAPGQAYTMDISKHIEILAINGTDIRVLFEGKLIKCNPECDINFTLEVAECPKANIDYSKINATYDIVVDLEEAIAEEVNKTFSSLETTLVNRISGSQEYILTELGIIVNGVDDNVEASVSGFTNSTNMIHGLQLNLSECNGKVDTLRSDKTNCLGDITDLEEVNTIFFWVATGGGFILLLLMLRLSGFRRQVGR